MEKHRMTGIQDFISSLVNDRYLWPGVYLDHLMKVIAAIASHGNAVIIGRGANFLIPQENRLSVRVIAPFDCRVKNVAKEFGVNEEEAKRRVINTQKLNQDAALGAVIGMLLGGKDIDKKLPAMKETTT